MASGEADTRPQPSPIIVVENIPNEYLVADRVRSFFGNFGQVEDVSVEVNQSRATVTFDTTAAAQRAISSPEAIFGNRFVRVYRSRQPPRPTPPTASRVSETSGSTSQGNTLQAMPPRPAVPLQLPSKSTATKLIFTPQDPQLQARNELALALELNAKEQKRLLELMQEVDESLSADQKRANMRNLRELVKESASLTSAVELNIQAASEAAARKTSEAESMAILTSLRKEVSLHGATKLRFTTICDSRLDL